MLSPESVPVADVEMPASAIARGSWRLSRDDLVAFGERMGRALAPPHVVALSGDLGSGKTTLAQAICRGYGVKASVTSPTFALVHAYEGKHSTVYHCDLYRLRDESELTNIGWDDLLNERALVLIEWPERAGSRLPEEVTHLHLDHVGDQTDVRVLTVGLE